MSTNDPMPTPPPGWQPPQVQAPPPPYGAAPYGSAPYGTPPPYGGAGYGYQPYLPPQTEGSAVAALVCSIVSFVICPVVPAIAALVIAPGARRKIDASNGRLTGLGLLTAAKWVSWINIVLWIGFTLLFVVLIIVGAMSDTSGSSDFSGGLRLPA